jgi:YfiH family protein
VTHITPNWPAPASVKACTTTRTLWGSPDPGSNDPTERARLQSLLALPADPIWLKQIHSTIAVPAEQNQLNTEADASYTDQTGRVCLVLTADCLPILVCNQQGTQVAAIHAGWRGLANGVIENTIRAMKTDPAQLLVWFGPAIGPQKFEVGTDVYQAFTQNNAALDTCFIPCAPEKWLANLYELAAARLNQIGVNKIFGGEYCTHTQSDLFFSYRRDQGKTGRMASVIWIAP